MHRPRQVLRGARIGVLVGGCFAAVYLVLGGLVTEFTELVGYSLLWVGFPTVFAILPLLKWLGIQGGLTEYAALVLLALPANGGLWGALFGAVASLGHSPDRQGG